MKTFKNLLQKKIERNPSPQFENQFWASFENEFGKKEKKAPSFGFLSELQLWLGSGALAAASLLFVLTRIQPSIPSGIDFPEMAQQPGSFEMIAQAELIQDYELFDDLAEIQKFPDRDDEWEILTGGTYEET
ncbi:MAG: hypothetical protein JNL01_09160 [Bdellovibrionales bacterium]|nr:hypothetical protein [Bdellovibrionales bacterium]